VLVVSIDPESKRLVTLLDSDVNVDSKRHVDKEHGDESSQVKGGYHLIAKAD